jgi:hypothetical protein
MAICAGRSFRRDIPGFHRQQAAEWRARNFSFVLRGYVRKWMSRIDASLRSSSRSGTGACERGRAPPQQQAAAAAKA